MTKLPIGIAALAQISPIAAIREDTIANFLGKDLLGKTITRTWYGHNFPAGAGNKCCLKQTTDIGAVIQALDASEDNQNIIIDKVVVLYQISSPNAFLFVPILALLENGESVSTTNGNDSDTVVVLNTAITGMFAHKFGPMIIGREIWDGANLYWLTTVTHDITAECIKYAKQMNRDLINEKSIKELVLAGQSVTELAEQDVDVKSLVVIHSHLNAQSIKNI